MIKKRDRLDILEKKIDKILKLENREIKEEKNIEKLEKKQLKKVESEEDELKSLEKLEKEIKKEVGSHPLTRLTIKDMAKAMVGAFVGIVSHFAFIEGAHLSESVSYAKASFLLVFAFVIGLVFIYATGFRKVKEKTLTRFFPLRVIAIYLVSLLSIFVVLYMYGIIEPPLDLGLLYKQIATISIPAIIGASAADLIGRE